MKTTKQLEEKVFSYIRKHHMLAAGDRVIAGISGGADSVCLLFLLLEWAKQVPLELAVVHVNHGIRREAEEDAAYVQKLCKEHDLKCYLREIDVPSLALQEKCSEEEAGRKARYAAFEEASQDFNANKIAVAHNSNDCSETMLFHLFRGSGIKGLGGIRPVRDRIIRPILCLERKEIEVYLKARGIGYCQDATNATDDYTRNRIRHHILPYAEEHIVQGCVSHMVQTAELLTEAEEYLEQQTQVALQRCVCNRLPMISEESQYSTSRLAGSSEEATVGKSQVYCLDVRALLGEHPLLQKRMLHTIVKELSPQHKDISYLHIQKLLDLFTGEGNRSINLPFGIQARREYTVIIVDIVDKRDFAFAANTVAMNTATINKSENLGDVRKENWKITVVDATDVLKNKQEVPENEYTKWLDYDKIKQYPVLRTRQPGDFLTLSDGSGGMIHKSLKDYMIDRKIPKSVRDEIPVLADGSHVLWLVGHRISEYFKITENTKRILQVEYLNK